MAREPKNYRDKDKNKAAYKFYKYVLTKEAQKDFYNFVSSQTKQN